MSLTRRPIFALIAVTAVVFGLAAQGKPPLHRTGGFAEVEEVAAGYAALFTCSAHFIMGRELADILKIELVDMAQYDLPTPEIDTQRHLVRVGDAIAAHRDNTGCTVLPPDWDASDIVRLPYIEYPDPPDRTDLPFPLGEKANPSPTRRQRAVLERAFDGSYGEGAVTTGVAVYKDGELLAERYAEGFGRHTGYRTWSTAKSITATLIGIASRDGLLDVAAPANIPEWQYFSDARRDITLTHLLHMSSGLESPGSSTYAVYFGGQDVISAVTTTPLEAVPGARWKYANNDTLLLLRALRASLQDDLRYMRYPYDELFHKIGMFDTRMEMDHRGNFVGSSQVYTTVRDLVRFGILYLNDGVWEGERILPEGWTEFVARPAPSLPRAPNERGYGAQFWLYDTHPGVPAGTYTSAGNKGQFSTIVPAENMVIVRTGVNPNGVAFRLEAMIVDIVEAF